MKDFHPLTMKTFERSFFSLSLKLLMADYSRPTSPKATEGSGLTMKDEVVLLHVTGTPGLVTISWFPLMLISSMFSL